MAHVTIEDCIVDVDNSFELVLLTAHRAKELAVGSYTAIRKEDDKNTVLALREIAKKVIDLGVLRSKLLYSFSANRFNTVVEISESKADEGLDADSDSDGTLIFEDFHDSVRIGLEDMETDLSLDDSIIEEDEV